MEINQQEPVNEWNHSLPVRIIKRLKAHRIGGVLSPRSERVSAASKAEARRLAADDDASGQQDERDEQKE